MAPAMYESEKVFKIIRKCLNRSAQSTFWFPLLGIIFGPEIRIALCFLSLESPCNRLLPPYLSCLWTNLDETNAIESEIECRLHIYHFFKYHTPLSGRKKGVALSGCGTWKALCTSLTYLSCLITDLDKTNTIQSQIKYRLHIYEFPRCHAPFRGRGTWWVWHISPSYLTSVSQPFLNRFEWNQHHSITNWIYITHLWISKVPCPF